jgi:hypothetical protein
MKEKNLQVSVSAVLEHFVNQKKILCFFMIPNGVRVGGNNPQQKAMYINSLKKQGFKPGVADLCVITEEKVFFLELKVGTNKQTDSQLVFEESLTNARCCEYIIIKDIDTLINLFGEKNEKKRF